MGGGPRCREFASGRVRRPGRGSVGHEGRGQGAILRGAIRFPTVEPAPIRVDLPAPRSASREGVRVMTEGERDLLRAIGARVAGPRHITSLGVDKATLELLDGLMAQGLVESVGYAIRDPGPLVRVCLTGRGWVRVKERTKP